MAVVIEAVPADRVTLYWPHVESHIASAIADYGHSWSIKDVFDDLMSSQMQLWVVWSGKLINGVICTHIYESGRGKTCAMPVVASSRMADVFGEALRVIEEFAKANGCKRLQGAGRKGWERALKPLGWTAITTQVEKVL